MTRLGAFEILYALKSGGMGDVLLGRRVGPGGFEQLVAVKTIRADLAKHEAVRTMFVEEARLLARLAHPAIATVLDFGEEGESFYLAMEYVRGIRFRELAHRRPPPHVAAQAVAEACRGLHAAHELCDVAGAPLGVVHRDLSPENLMLGYDGQVKVLDFGIALVRGRATVTELGTIKGKPPYMSPEQVKNQALDRRSDVFSMGLVLHELLTGEPVFEGESLYAVARAVIDAPIAPPSAKAGALPPGLDEAVMRALVRDPAGRTPTAAALAEELERIVAGSASLESWAEAALAREREAHRAWLAGLLAAPEGSTRAGRTSGVVTVPASPPRPAPEAAPEPATDPEPPARRGRRAPAIVALAAVLAAAVGVAVIATRGGGTSAAAAAPDAAVVAAAPDAAVTPEVPATSGDAAPEVPATSGDATPEVPATSGDAGRRRRVRSPPVDAAPPPPRPVDAAVAAAAPGKITITAEPFALVRIDGKDWGTTPVYGRRIAAGRHTVELIAPDTGEVRLRKEVDVRSGALERIDL